MAQNIKAILFDSGRVLNKPVTGHWFITPNFFSFVDESKFYSIPQKERNVAFNEAGRYIDGIKLISSEDEELKHFTEYYRIFAGKLPQLELDIEQIQGIARDLVLNYNKYVFFSDVGETLEALSKKYKLAVVSDAWPSLENVFVNADFRKYFSSFIISSKLGVTKPDELMYKTALDELGVAPEEALFIDDNTDNCEGAKRLGIKTALLCRNPKYYIFKKITCRGHRVIRSLGDLKI